MTRGRRGLLIRARADDGFTIVESLVAVTVLSIAIVLSIQPVITALRGVSEARVISVAENLAQAEIEVIRSLDYDEIGLPGRTPEGGLTAEREITVEGRDYIIEVDVQYAGSITGLAIIPQGGDGVEGSWDPGVDYKVARITVIPEGREADPVVMETIIAPDRVGAHEGFANAKVLLAAHEPFAPSGADLPTLKIHNPPAAEILSAVSASEQVWPGVPPGTYTVLVDNPNGWVIHPQDLIDGLDVLTVVAGSTAETTLRVYRPATFEIEVQDIDSGEAISDASLTLTNIDSGQATAYLPGEYVVNNLLPDGYEVKVTAPEYLDWTLASLNIPAAYPNPYHKLTVYMERITPTTTTTTGGTTTTVGSGSTTTTTTTTVPEGPRSPVEFTVIDNRNMVVAGASVQLTHPTDGPLSGVTDIFGRITFNLLDGEDYSATGSTVWGHGPDTDLLTVGGPIDALDLSRPSGKGTMTLQGGEDAEFLYRPWVGGPWNVMPANFENKASFVQYSGWYEVAKRCIVTGEIQGAKTVRVRADRNRTTTINGWCPPS